MELSKAGVNALELRDGETLTKPGRWVCEACLTLAETEPECGNAKHDKCIVCGETGPVTHTTSQAAEECHRALAAIIQNKARIRRMLMDNVLCLMDYLRDRRKERTTSGGIILPGTDKPGDMEPVVATVIAAGPGWYDEQIIHNEGQPGWKQPKASRRFNRSELRGGDRVLVDHAISGDSWVVENVEYRIVRESNVLGVLEEEGVAAE